MGAGDEAPRVLVLERGTVEPGTGLVKLLSREEVGRSQRFGRAERRAQFLWGRLVTRAMVAHVLGCAGSAVRLIENAPYPPVVAGAENLHLSLAHSGRWVACALAVSPVGIDIEDTSIERDTSALAEAGLPKVQCAWVHSRADTARAFYEMWTFNESLVKLAVRPQPTLDFSARGRPRVVAPGGEQWLCRHGTGYVMAAIARRARSSRIEQTSPVEVAAWLL